MSLPTRILSNRPAGKLISDAHSASLSSFIPSTLKAAIEQITFEAIYLETVLRLNSVFP